MNCDLEGKYYKIKDWPIENIDLHYLLVQDKSMDKIVCCFRKSFFEPHPPKMINTDRVI